MRLRSILALAGVILWAGVAAAKRPPKWWINVDDFTPKAGPPGTQVTITGRGFIKQTTVIFDGRPVREDYWDQNTIRFSVPEGREDGILVLRQPGARNDIIVGTFRVTGPAGAITGFSPRSGPPGTRVEIYGSFPPGDRLRFNDRDLEPVDRSPSRVVVVIPPGARDDAFDLVRPATGQHVSSADRFNVTSGAPFITGFTPPGGGPGQMVRIDGGNFESEDDVFYGRIQLMVTRHSRDRIDVVIPQGLTMNEPFVVRGPRGEARSAAAFQLASAVAIAEFRPTFGGRGTRVWLHGSGFRPGDVVYLGAVPAIMYSLEEGKIVVAVPDGAVTDLFTLRRSGRIIATSASAFVVGAPASPPLISTFFPSSGPPGTEVTLQGAGFTPDVRVSYAGLALPIVSRKADATLNVVVPRSATSSAPFVVTTRQGETRTGAWFDLRLAAGIESVTPTSGGIFTPVTIRGKGFRGDEIFYLNQQPMRNVERRGDSYLVEIPNGASSGPISFDSGGQRYRTPFRFEVVITPVIAAFSPGSGPPRTRVVLTGQFLDAVTGAFYGSLGATILRRAPGELVLEIPPGAQGADFLSVDAGGQRVRANERFRVIPPGPWIDAMSPESGPQGTHVTLSGTGFTPGATVFFGNMSVPIVSRGPGRIVIAIPGGAAGRARINVVDDAGIRGQTAAFFEVIPPPPPPPPPPVDTGHHEHAHEHPHPDGGHHHHPHVHPHREGVNHHHPY